MTPVIKVENLGKKYTISHLQREGYSSLRDALTNSVATFGKSLIRPFRSSLAPQLSPLIPESEDFWALKDVSFDVKQGDRIGIIGRNGAGKSTLLKILSRITEPTTGSIRIKGRVASLLEVGTGFHPELTGRENIFLNGAILGMSRAEIMKKFDEIVDFAEIEKFLDTPVKRYSSGMYVRLAFAVAAHLEPEILIVDEVLAVGDAQFQKKCLGKMEDVSAKEGRTVLFVSHQIQAIQAICNTSMVLKNGVITFLGSTEEALENYFRSGVINRERRMSLFHAPRSGGNQRAIQEAWIENSTGELVTEVFMGEKIKIFYRFEASHILLDPGFGFSIDTVHGMRLATYGNYVEKSKNIRPIKSGIVCFELTRNILLPGHYLINFGLSEKRDVSIDYLQGAIDLTVLSSDVFKTGRSYEPSHGFFCMDVMLDVAND
jgi:lipopolysaccharide transport system ATP-binding protein